MKQLEYDRFVDWTATPPSQREPKFQKELAIELNVEEATLSDWKKKPEFWSNVKEKITIWAKDKNAEVYKSLYKRIKENGDPNAIKLWIQTFDEFEEASRVTIDPVLELLKKYEVLANDSKNDEPISGSSSSST